MSLNSGLSEFSQVGKFLTVYPRSADEAVDLARELHRVTRGLAGPRIPFDARYRTNGIVYYRYGAFRSSGKRPGVISGPKGKRYSDRCLPGKAIPRWLKNPFSQARAHSRSPKSTGPIGRDYLPFRAKIQRGKGGVYEALDLSVSPARLVIIKEGRRHGETAWDGEDGYARVKHEGHVLRALHRAGVPVPEFLHEFSQDGNRYLVLEKIEGRPLLPRNRLQPAKVSWRRAQRFLDQLGELLSRLHAVGWVWRDCKPSHIFLKPGAVRPIDFEGACKVGETRVLPWGSLNYVPPGRRTTLCRRAGVTEDDYALGVIVFQLGVGKFPPVNPSRRTALYRRSCCPAPLRIKIEGLLLGKKAKRR